MCVLCACVCVRVCVCECVCSAIFTPLCVVHREHPNISSHCSVCSSPSVQHGYRLCCGVSTFTHLTCLLSSALCHVVARYSVTVVSVVGSTVSDWDYLLTSRWIFDGDLFGFVFTLFLVCLAPPASLFSNVTSVVGEDGVLIRWDYWGPETNIYVEYRNEDSKDIRTTLISESAVL